MVLKSQQPTTKIEAYNVHHHLHILPGNSGDSVHKLGFEEDVGVVEHAVLERDNDELGTVEMAPQHLTNVLLEHTHTDTRKSEETVSAALCCHTHTP